MTERDYVQMARSYEGAILDGTIPACRWVMLAVERNRRDLARQGTADFPYVFRPDAASAICAAVELLPHVEGPEAFVTGVDELDRPIWNPITLQPWQAWIYTTVFGWCRLDGARRFRTALSFVPRKNGKSTMSAAVALYMLAADGESGARVFSSATSRDQAKIVFNTARTMAERSHGFRDFFGVDVLAHELQVASTNSNFRALASDSNTLEGLNVSCAIIDELHAHRSREVWEVLGHATGARRQPLIWGISTAGDDIAGICYEQIEYLRKVLDRVVDDETFFGVEYTIDPPDDWKDPAAHRKANPNYGISIMPDDMDRLARKAVHSPAAVGDFVAKRLNVWVTSSQSWMPMDEWRACGDPTLTIEDLKAFPCWIGVDLAEVRDIAAVVALFLCDDGRFAAIGRFYLPEDTVGRSPIAQFSGWVRQGYIIATPGGATDYQRIEEDIAEWCGILNVQEVAFDRALAAQMAQRLMARFGEAPPVITVPQGVDVINPAMQWLERQVIEKTFRHASDPVLTWMASNVVVQRNHKGEIYPRKAGGKDSHNKIDGITAILTCGTRALLRSGITPAAEAGIQLW